MVIAHNINAMNAQRQYNVTGLNRRKSTEKLSSGYKINRAADDAAGLSISEKMRRQIRGLDRGTENMQDGVSWLQTGDGAMGDAHDILQRINELAVHGANGVLSRSDREAIDAEVQQLKTEIDRINVTAKFNELRIFSDDTQEPNDNGEVYIEDLGFAPDDLKIFNGTYDDATGTVSYGGIVFRGERITWEDLAARLGAASPLVYADAGKQRFHEGTWVLMDGQRKLLTISANEGDEVPRITRNFDVTADADGLIIDGETIPWKEIKNKAGEAVTDTDYVNGSWTANYHGADLTFKVENAFNGISGMIAAINQEHDENRIHVCAAYCGSDEVKAVDADMNRTRVPLKDPVAADMINKMLLAADPSEKSYFLRADKQGLCLQDGKTGTEIPQSKVTWEELTKAASGGGGASGASAPPWMSGSYIDDSTTYTYVDPSGSGVSFTFQLSDITSVDSVVDGLDMVPITPGNVTNYYQTAIEKNSTDPNLKGIQLQQSVTTITLADEIALNRDFSSQTASFKGDLQYTPPSVALSYKNGVVAYHGDVSSIRDAMEAALEAYENTVIQLKTQIALAGGDPNGINKGLEYVLGPGCVSPSGTMQDQPGSSLQFPAGWIDFSCLDNPPDQTETILKKLIGNGFDSTCGTCSRHYSFQFVDTITGASTTSHGFEYKADKSSYNAPKLEISVSSLLDKLPAMEGNTNGERAANALKELAVEAGFQDHFQKYIVEGTKFYVSESRPQSGWSNPDAAQFYTKPFNQDTTKNYTLTLDSTATNPSNGYQQLSYQYDHSGYADEIHVEMVKNTVGGQYVKNDVTGAFELYNPAIHVNVTERYDVGITYGNGGTATADDIRKDYIDRAVNNMINATSATLNATDYTVVDYSGDENDNVAIDSLFRASSTTLLAPRRWDIIKGEENIQIQKSGDVPNRLMIPRFSINCSALGLKYANCLTEADSRNAIDMAARALKCMNVCRSLYGALQNSIEHAVRSNKNTSENTTAAESRIRDTDMAEEMVNLSKYNILEQAGQAMMAQANRNPQDVLSLLQ